MYNMQCTGCGHRTAMILIDKLIEEYKLQNKIIICLDVACCSLLIDELKYDAIMCPHGRTLPVATGIKKVQKNKIVISYMGDGAAYSIGTNELIHSAHRNDDIFCIIINNGLFAMTGGQTTPACFENEKPFDIMPLLTTFKIPFLARAALTDKKHIDTCKCYLNEMLNSYQKNGGFHLLEFLSPCPTNNHMTTKENTDYINDKIIPILPCKRYI